MIPNALPVLSAGAHESPHEGACVMEYVSLLAGEPWSDSPSCTHPVLARMAQVMNDRLSDAERPALVPLIGRLFGTAPTGTDLEQRQLSVRLAAWCATQVLPRTASGGREVCERAISAALAWAEEPNEENANAADAAAYAAAAYAYDAAANAAAYAYDAAAYAAAYDAAANAAAYAADAAAYAAAADDAAAYAAAADDAAAYAAAADAAANLGGLLTGLLDEYDRITGRTSHDTDAASKAARLYAQATK